MKKIIVFLLAVTACASSGAQVDISQKLDSMMTIYTNCNKFNGSVLVAKGGKVLLEKGYGFKNAGDRTLNDAHTIFQIGSVTKEFTAAIVLKLAAQKKLSLNDPLSKYFPSFPKGDSIRIKNLLSHSSGIFNYTDVFDFWKQSDIPANEQMVLDTLQQKNLLFSPGTKFSYSNSNYMLLAYIIQKLTKEPYETVVRNWVFSPLKMSHSGFDFKHLQNTGKSTGYWNFSAAKYVEGPPNDSSEFIGSGSMYSSVDDLYKWHLALQAGKVLDKATLAQAYQPFKGPYGYGWELDSMAGRKTVGHNGRVYGFESKMTRVPEDDVFIVLLNNHSDGPWLHQIALNTMAILYGQPFSAPEAPLQLTDDKLAAFAGKFAGDKDHIFEVRLIAGHLFGSEADHPDRMMELLPLAGNRLKFMEHEGEEGFFDVEMDENGNAAVMRTTNPRGMKLVLKKIK